MGVALSILMDTQFLFWALLYLRFLMYAGGTRFPIFTYKMFAKVGAFRAPSEVNVDIDIVGKVI